MFGGYREDVAGDVNIHGDAEEVIMPKSQQPVIGLWAATSSGSSGGGSVLGQRLSPPMTRLAGQREPMENGTDAGLQLVVQNTFLTAKEAIPDGALRRTSSEPSISKSSSEESESDKLYILWESSSSSRQDQLGNPTSGSGFRQDQQNATSPLHQPAQATAGHNNLPSAGSIGHHIGNCKPCCFFRRGKCVKDLGCNYCHFKQHDLPSRPGKQTRDRAKLKAQKAKAREEAGGQAHAVNDDDDEKDYEEDGEPHSSKCSL